MASNSRLVGDEDIEEILAAHKGQQPSRDSAELVDERIVVLHNSYGEVGRYYLDGTPAG